MSRAPTLASVVAVSLLSTSLAFAQTPPVEALPPPPPTEAVTAPPVSAATRVGAAASVLAPGAAWNLTPPATQRAFTREPVSYTHLTLPTNREV